jgi:hypothetical protein
VRTVEMVLLVVNVFTLLLCLGKLTKGGRLWAVGINLSLLFIHGAFEGFRYQMAFSYIFVFLFAFYSWLRIKGLVSRVKLSKAMKV